MQVFRKKPDLTEFTDEEISRLTDSSLDESIPDISRCLLLQSLILHYLLDAPV